LSASRIRSSPSPTRCRETTTSAGCSTYLRVSHHDRGRDQRRAGASIRGLPLDARGRCPVRTIRHWTPRYVYDRTSDLLYAHRHPGLPWITRQATDLLAGLLRPSDRGLEFGSGRSTL